MTNSMNPNKGHYNPGPIITHPKTPAPTPTKPADKSAEKGGR